MGSTILTRPVWFFFNPYAIRTTRQGGKQEEAWFHYYKEGGVVLALKDMDFEFDASLGVVAQHRWSMSSGDKFYVGPITYDVPAIKPIFDVNAVGDSYSEEHYPENEKKNIHHLAKYCEHEFWHSAIRGETRWPFGLGHADSDGDNLSNAREAELGTNPNVKDTCGLSRYAVDYGDYASYADEELFCRWKQGFAPRGNVSKDWSIVGAQKPTTND